VWRSYDDALLLRQGSAVALLSELLGDWVARDPAGSCGRSRSKGRFDHLPAAHRAVQAGLEGPDEMYAHLDVVYDEYVLAFFETLASEGRPGEGVASGKARPRSTFREPR
jgi:hypothetical protein